MVQALRDPWKTASILVAFLTTYNIVLALVHVITSVLFGTKVNPIDQVWDFRDFHFRSIPGYKAFFVHVLSACAMVAVEVLQVRRAKLVLDYAMTAQVFLLFLTWAYSGQFPYATAWWFTWCIGSCIMVFGGEYVCMQIELRPIAFGTVPATETAATTVQVQQAPRSSLGSRIGRLSTIISRRTSEDIELQERGKLMEGTQRED